MSLFQTRAWKDTWWALWGGHPGFVLVEAGLEGASDLYVDSYRLKGVLPVRCLQFIGTNYRRLSTPRTEYNRVSAGLGNNLDNRLAEIVRQPWSEFVLRDLRKSDGEIEAIKGWATENGWLCREIHRDRTYAIDTQGSFDDYLRSLGSNTRLKLYNRRKVFEAIASWDEVNFWPERTDEFFQRLNSFHESRWGQPCFNQESLSFHKSFLKAVVLEGGQLELFALMSNGQVVSLLYNVTYEGRVYNLQSGYAENFHKKIALGTLHLGYAIERAFHTPDLNTFDMLAGEGKNTDYKERLASSSEALVSLMLVRSPVSRLAYRLNTVF